MSKVKCYAWNAKDYANNSQNQFQWAQELIPKAETPRKRGISGNIGCGDGKITAEIAKCLPKGRVVGIDSSGQMINLANNTYLNQEYPNLSFQVMDARKNTFNHEFDLIFSNAALHWIATRNPFYLGFRKA